MATPAYNWSGFYVGVNAGAGWTASDVGTGVCSGSPISCYWTGEGDSSTPGRVATAGSGHLSDTLFTGGGQVGANWQRGAFVFGVEGDVDSFHSRASHAGTTAYTAGSAFGATIADSVSTNVLATVRGRIGYATGPLLLYATGGLALADFNHSSSYGEYGFSTAAPCAGSTGGNYCSHGSGVVTDGWVVGAGAEWAFQRNWSLKAEYLYVDLGNVSSTSALLNGAGTGGVTSTSGTPQFIQHSSNFTAQIARVGVNYKLGGAN